MLEDVTIIVFEVRKKTRIYVKCFVHIVFMIMYK